MVRQCKVNHALALLPHVSSTLIRLTLWKTYNAQGPYLLRAVAQNGILPALRSLGIERDSGNSPKLREGHRWREDDNGNVLAADGKRPARQYDRNYILSLSKAAPNLEELELKGTLNDTIVSLLYFWALCPSALMQYRNLSLPPYPDSPSYSASFCQVATLATKHSLQVLDFGMIMIMIIASPTAAMLLVIRTVCS
jgi:hypothetical protein